MNAHSDPLVSIVTPMYNNVEYLQESIESVLSQTYRNWDYVIVNNCSTDGSAEIARRYAASDPRIRVYENTEFLPMLANHNHALRQISPDSKYCKIVFSDDWIFPRCIEDMVAAAEAHPSVGIVGAYGLQGRELAVKWASLPYPSELVAGRELGRIYFLRGEHDFVFGTAHSLLFRSDLVRQHDPFFNESNLHADTEACVNLLRQCDFSFVHQVLTYRRERTGSATEYATIMNTSVGCRLYELLTYGAYYLNAGELEACLDRVLKEYYNFLGVSVIKGRRNREFWRVHRDKLAESGLKLSQARIAGAIVSRIGRAILHPRETLLKIQG